MSGIKRVSLSIKQKVSIINEIKDSSKEAICKKYGCSVDTINRILRNQNAIIQSSKTCNNMSRKRDRLGKSKKVEKAVSKWFDQMRANGAVVSTNMIMKKAQQFGIALNENFKPTLGWLYRWQRREGISLKKINGEAFSADKEGENKFQELFSSLIATYNPRDIFNADETGLLFKALPSSSLNKKKNYKIAGIKLPNDRITFLFLCNATGDYKKIFAIGKPKQSRCFKSKTLPFKYFSQKKAWMAQDIWREIMIAFDEEMIKQNRKVIVFVDNASAHKETHLKNVDVRYIPQNITSILQPLKQGIILAFKSYYRQLIIRKQICFLETGKNIEDFKKSVDILTALHIAKRAFSMITPNTIFNCFKKCKFVSESTELSSAENLEDEIILPTNISPESETNFENFVSFDNNLPCYAPPNEDEIVAEIQTSEDSDDEGSDIDDNIPVPSVSKALDCLNSLRCFLLAKNACGDELEKIEQYIFANCCRNVQTNITEFFKK